MDGFVEITIKIPVAYVEKLRSENSRLETSELDNILKQLPSMVKNMLPQNFENLNRDEQKNFVVTTIKSYPQIKDMISSKMINELCDYFKCSVQDLGLKTESPTGSTTTSEKGTKTATPAYVEDDYVNPKLLKNPENNTSNNAPPQMADMMKGIMSMLAPPADSTEGEGATKTNNMPPEVANMMKGIMGMLNPQNGSSSATVVSGNSSESSNEPVKSVPVSATETPVKKPGKKSTVASKKPVTNE